MTQAVRARREDASSKGTEVDICWFKASEAGPKVHPQSVHLLQERDEEAGIKGAGPIGNHRSGTAEQMCGPSGQERKFGRHLDQTGNTEFVSFHPNSSQPSRSIANGATEDQKPGRGSRCETTTDDLGSTWTDHSGL